jgi:hypothetical protein
MRYLLLLASLVFIVACSSAQKTETIAVALPTRSPVPTWTPTPFVMLPAMATKMPESDLASLSLAQVESLVGLPFEDQMLDDGPTRQASYQSPHGGIMMVTLATDLSYFVIGWMRITPNDQDTPRKFVETLGTLSKLLLSADTVTEAIAFVNTCLSDSVIPAIPQVKKAECRTTLNNTVTIAVQYLPDTDTVAVYMKPTYSP